MFPLLNSPAAMAANLVRLWDRNPENVATALAGIQGSLILSGGPCGGLVPAIGSFLGSWQRGETGIAARYLQNIVQGMGHLSSREWAGVVLRTGHLPEKRPSLRRNHAGNGVEGSLSLDGALTSYRNNGRNKGFDGHDSLACVPFSTKGVFSGFPCLLGQANTPELVVGLFQRYPWIFGPFTVSHVLDVARERNLTPNEVLIDWMTTLREHNGAILGELNAAENITYQIALARGSLMPILGLFPKLAQGLLSHYFGTTGIYDEENKMIGPPLSPRPMIPDDELSIVRGILRNHGLSALFEYPKDPIIYFFARVLYPHRFGFRRTMSPPRPSKLGTYFQSSVSPVRRSRSLPSSPSAYTELTGETESWSRLNSVISFVPGALELPRDLFPSAVTDHPIEILLEVEESAGPDVIPDIIRRQMGEVLEKLLNATPPREIYPDRPLSFRGDRVRFVIRTRLGPDRWEVSSLHEYGIMRESDGRVQSFRETASVFEPRRKGWT